MGKERVLYNFQDGSDGAVPFAGVISDAAGNLYGTTYIGGRGSCQFGGCGTVFKLAPDGTENVLYAFSGGDDGAEPFAGLIADREGNLYGTAALGGAFDNGTIFKVTPDGSETTLYAFRGGSDGYLPSAGLLSDGKGDLYGTTGAGGINGNCNSGCGTVFKLKPDGTKVLLYAFQGGTDGGNPVGTLIADNSGDLYGMTFLGGADCDGITNGCGTVFKIAPDGTETQLHLFQGGSDGRSPDAGLVADLAGNLYGTTAAGGDAANCPPDGCGTIFKLAPDGTETVLYAFRGGSDGSSPFAGLIMDTAGNLYGTTYAGGSTGCEKDGGGCGTVFKLAPDGTETILKRLGGKGGGKPAAPLLLRKRVLYGTTTGGGLLIDGRYNGVVFSLKK